MMDWKTSPQDWLHSASRRPERFIGREALLQDIREILASTRDDPRTVVLLLRAPGGMGKTRFLEEVLMRLGHPEVHRRLGLPRPPEPWPLGGGIRLLPTNLLDFALPQLSARSHLLVEMRAAAIWPGSGAYFPRFQSAYERWQDALQVGGTPSRIIEARRNLEERFRDDIQDLFEQDGLRLVWAWDTAEQLALPLQSPMWKTLDEGGLLKDLDHPLVPLEDATFITALWFLHRLRQGWFGPTTMLLAGREEEGQALWAWLKHWASQPDFQDKVRLIEKTLEPFTLEETRRYLLVLQESLPEPEAEDPEAQARYQSIQEQLNWLAEENLEAFYKLTQGQPVRLALYADVFTAADPDAIPWEALEAEPTEDERRRLERLVRDLFLQRAAPHQDDEDAQMRARLLLYLARSPRGLSLPQLAYLLRHDEDFGPNLALGQAELEARVARLARDLLRLSLVKIQPLPRLGAAPRGTAALEEGREGTFRLVLQDEILRIFTEQFYTDREEEEPAKRRWQYEKLRQWAEERAEYYRRIAQTFLEQDLHSVEVTDLNRALQPSWRRFSPWEKEQRVRVAFWWQFWRLERLHYDLLLDPVAAWNEAYVDLADERWYAGDLEADFLVQREVHILHTPLMRTVIALMHAENGSERSKQYQIERMLVAAKVEDAARWIKRFIAVQRYARAVELAEAVEQALDAMPEERRKADAWRHPFSWGERQVWRLYAHILSGRELEASLQQLERIADMLCALVRAPKDEQVAVLSFLETDQIHWPSLPDFERVDGFRGALPEPRLHRVIALAYNFLGYGHVVRGDFVQGIRHYRHALRHMQKVDFPAQEATTWNNLGRALAAVGKEERGLELVYQALRQRYDMAALAPYILSLNTTALINNDMGRPLRALYQALHVVALAARIGDWRTYGLGLLQVAQGARRLTKSADPSLVLALPGLERRSILLDVAERAAQRAKSIFAPTHDGREDARHAYDEPRAPEPARYLEALLEHAEILQDRISKLGPREDPGLVARWARESLAYLEQAWDVAQQYGFQVKAKILINQIETYYWWAIHGEPRHKASRLREAEAIFDKMREGRILPDEAFVHQLVKGAPQNGVKSSQQQNGQQDITDELRRDHAPAWQELAKRYRFRGAIHLERALEPLEEAQRALDSSDPSLAREKRSVTLNDLPEDVQQRVREHLENAAEAFVLALIYGQLFAPESRAVKLAFRMVYRYLKPLRKREMLQDFATSARKHWEVLRQKQALEKALAACPEEVRRTWDRFWALLPPDMAALPDWLEDVALLPDETEEREPFNGST